MSESFAALLDESLSTLEMQPGSIVTGVVLPAHPELLPKHSQTLPNSAQTLPNTPNFEKS